MRKIRSNHNSLLNYFLYDKEDLSKEYVKKCEDFIDSISAEIHIRKLKEHKKEIDKQGEDFKV